MRWGGPGGSLAGVESVDCVRGGAELGGKRIISTMYTGALLETRDNFACHTTDDSSIYKNRYILRSITFGCARAPADCWICPAVTHVASSVASRVSVQPDYTVTHGLAVAFGRSAPVTALQTA